MQLTTQQKNDYLKAMGITQWYPRKRLNLGQAPWVVEKPESVHTEEQPSAGVSLPRSGPDIPQLQSVAELTAASPSSAPVAAPEVEAETPVLTQTSSASRPIHFGLGLYVLGPSLVVSSLTEDYQHHQEPAFRLLQAILSQFGQSASEPAYHHVIAWPFFSNPNADQGKTAASQYVNGVIEHLVEEHPIQRIICFGGVLAKLNDWDSAEGEYFGRTRLNLPSLFKMLQDPRQKAKAWALMQSSSFFQK